jgi:hypothetical protein
MELPEIKKRGKGEHPADVPDDKTNGWRPAPVRFVRAIVHDDEYPHQVQAGQRRQQNDRPVTIPVNYQIKHRRRDNQIRDKRYQELFNRLINISPFIQI